MLSECYLVTVPQPSATETKSQHTNEQRCSTGNQAQWLTNISTYNKYGGGIYTRLEFTSRILMDGLNSNFSD